MSVVASEPPGEDWPDEAPVPAARRREEFVPLHDLDAEMAVLGGMMLSKDAIGDVVETLKPRDYYRPAHTLVHQAVVHLWQQGEPADPITVADELAKRGDLARVGGASNLHTLVNSTPTAANAAYYAEIVHEKAVLRRLDEAGQRIIGLARAGEGEVDQIAQASEAAVLEAISDRSIVPSYAPIGDDTEKFFDALEQLQNGARPLTGLSTGFADFDNLTSGLHPGQMIVIGARPAVGKSTVALDLARACSIKQGLPSVFFSLEMGREEIVMRTYSAEAKVALHHLKAGTLTEDDWLRLARARPRIQDAPLVIDDSPDLTLLEIRSRSRRLSHQYGGLGLIVIDYLQLLNTGSTKRYGNRQEEVAEMSRNIKLLAKELQVPVIALSQLNRGPEQRQDKRPVVSDLRESGAVEQDADIVLLLHRDDVYERESPRAGELDLIVGKHRGGPTATITVAFQGHYSRAIDMAQS